VSQRLGRQQRLPDEIEVKVITCKGDDISLVSAMTMTGLASSNSEARRLIEQGGVSADGSRVISINFELQVEKEFLIKVGKRKFAKIRLKKE